MATPARVEDDLGWTLGTVLRAHLQAAREVADGLPGGHRGYQVLIAAGRDEPRSQLALARQLGVDRTVMTYLLDELEQAGLLVRRPDPADRRARRVELTDVGRARLCALERGLAEAEEHLLAPLDAGERAALRALLRRVATHAGGEQATPCDVARSVEGVDGASLA